MSQPFLICAAEQVLNHFRERFIKDMDADAIVFELYNRDIISDSDKHRIISTFGRKQQNEILHRCLVRTCTHGALIEACDIMIAVPGSPKIKGLANEMKMQLLGKCCMYVFMYACMHECVNL